MSSRRTHLKKEEAKHNANSKFVIGDEGFRRRKPWSGARRPRQRGKEIG